LACITAGGAVPLGLFGLLGLVLQIVLVVAVALRDGSVHSCDVSTRRPAELASWMAYFNALLAYYSPEA